MSTWLHAVFVVIVVLATATGAIPVRADQPHIPRLGILASKPLEDSLRSALSGLGYVEGKNIAIHSTNFVSGYEEQQSLAADLVRSNVDIIVATGSPAAQAAMAATTRIPVIFTSGDPIAAGFARSLARPGGKGTGVSILSYELYRKCVEFLHQALPRARRIAFLSNPTNPLMAKDSAAARGLETAAQTAGIDLVVADARDVHELDAVLRKLSRRAVDGVIVSGEIFFLAHMREIADTIRKAGLPACFAFGEYHEVGVLMSYGPSNKDMMRYVAGYVDKILKGAKPADLPIEQISKYQLVINLRVARELGIKVPQELLLRADEVIK